MTDYESMKVGELRKLITDKDDFKDKMGTTMSSASKLKLVNYLNGVFKEGPKLRKSPSESDLSKLITNKPFDPNPPKVDKQFVPDPTKLSKIREELPQPEQKVVDEVPEELAVDLDDDDVHKLSNILSDEPVVESPSYIYNEAAEVKCKKYLNLFSNLKPIVNSPDFKSSEEKLRYVQHYIDSTRMNANLTSWLFGATTYMERSPSVNKYIKLRGYTTQLAKRKDELETYIEELKIKYMDEIGEYLTMPVEARIALVFAETAYMVHTQNSAIELQNEIAMKMQQNHQNSQNVDRPPTMK